MSDISKVLAEAGTICSYIPVISLPSNIVEIFLKSVVLPLMSPDTINQNHYYTYLDRKSYSDCFLLAVPFGFILVSCCSVEGEEPLQEPSQEAVTAMISKLKKLENYILSDVGRFTFQSEEEVMANGGICLVSFGNRGGDPSLNLALGIPVKEFFRGAAILQEDEGPVLHLCTGLRDAELFESDFDACMEAVAKELIKGKITPKFYAVAGRHPGNTHQHFVSWQSKS